MIISLVDWLKGIEVVLYVFFIAILIIFIAEGLGGRKP